jgi:hypothetical protein
MRQEELEELHYITLIGNVASILTKGILSHHLAERVPHESVAMQEIQDIRSNKVVPGGRKLHEYANMYFNARNAMLYLRSNAHAQLCVLRISHAILDLDGVIVTDRNAASSARFSPVSTGLALINRDLVFAEYWNHPGDAIGSYNHKKIMCAEVLVPNFIPFDYIFGAYVSCIQSQTALLAVAPDLEVTIDPHFFFLEVRQ